MQRGCVRYLLPELFDTAIPPSAWDGFPDRSGIPKFIMPIRNTLQIRRISKLKNGLRLDRTPFYVTLAGKLSRSLG